MPKDTENIFTARRIFSWAYKGGFAVLDQALFSGANFITSILLARWLTPVQYGAYAFAFSLFMFINSIHTAAFISPMLVYGGGRYRHNQPRYMVILIYGHIITMLPIAFILLVAGVIMGKFYSLYIQDALFGLAVGGPLVLLLWLIRRAFYIRFKPAHSAIGGGVYLALFLGSIYFLHITHRLTQCSAFVVMGLSAFLVIAFFIYNLSLKWTAVSGLTSKEVLIDHWKYGKWSLATAGASWFQYNIYFLILPLCLGLKGTAILKVIMNIGMIAVMSNMAICMSVVPLLSRYFYENKEKMAIITKFFLGIFIVADSFFALILIFFPKMIMTILYGTKYQEFYYFVPLVALIAVPSGVSSVLMSALRARERPDKAFWFYLITAIITLCCGIPLAIGLGVEGAILAILLSSLMLCTIFLIFA